MLDQHDLRSIKILSRLSDMMLNKIEKITSVISYGRDQYIFKERDRAEYLYAVIKGKIGLEINLNSGAPFMVKCIYPGKIFGISSVVDSEKRATICHARALEHSIVYRWKGSHLETLFEQDYEQAYIFLRSIGKILKTRLEFQRVQLVEGLYNEQLKSA